MPQLKDEGANDRKLASATQTLQLQHHSHNFPFLHMPRAPHALPLPVTAGLHVLHVT